MAWDKGFNFRASAGFVSDGANETYVTGAVYPVTRNAVTFGWDADISSGDRDRDALVDRRLAGVNQISNTGTQRQFRVDLPAPGDYTIRLALGDTGGSQSYMYWKLLDNTTLLATIDDSNGVLQDVYDDATGVERTEANWPAQNATITKTFATSILIVVIGTPGAQAGSSLMTHMFVSQAVVAAAAALSGDAAAGINEGAIVAGGKQIVLTLTGDTWRA